MIGNLPSIPISVSFVLDFFLHHIAKNIEPIKAETARIPAILPMIATSSSDLFPSVVESLVSLREVDPIMRTLGQAPFQSGFKFQGFDFHPAVNDWQT